MPAPGTEVAFDVTDAGRVALGGTMGPEIAQIEGRLLDSQNGDFVVSVSSVKLLRGGQQIWTGERVRIDKNHVGRVYEKRFSKGRTIALGAVAVGGVTAFMLSRDLGVFGRKTIDPPPDTGETFTIPIRVRP